MSRRLVLEGILANPLLVLEFFSSPKMLVVGMSF